MSLADRRGLRLFTLCALYVAQGIPWGFMATTLPGYLTQRGVDAGIVGAMLSFTTLPYSFKWIWGPIIDSFTIHRFGKRRPWIVFAQAMMAATMIVLVTFDLGTDIKLLTWTILIHTVFNSLQDVSVDAMATDLLEDSERGLANGLMYGSKYLGGGIGGYGVAKLMSETSLDTALIAQTIVLVAIMLVPIFVRERNEPAAEAVLPEARTREPAWQRVVGPLRETLSAMGQAFSLRSTIVASLLMLSANFAIGVIAANGYPLFITKLGWTYDELAVITGGWGLVVGGTCAAATGFLVDKFGRRRVAAIALCAMATGWTTFSLLESYWHVRTLVYVSGFYEAACQSVMSVALIALCMDLTWPKIAGSMFAAFMALSNFSTTLGYQFAAKISSLLGFSGTYLACAGMQLVVALLLIPIDRLEVRTKLPLPAGTKPNRVGLTAFLVLVAFLIAMTIKQTLKYVG
ncbi:MAG: MFS transporter [Kofleriaceae bacterium]|nr:MFS transporter [Kofleriaceae bacterium]